MSFTITYRSLTMLAILVLFASSCGSNGVNTDPKSEILDLLEIDDKQYQEALSLGLISAEYDTSCFENFEVLEAIQNPSFNVADSLSPQEQLVSSFEQLYLLFGDNIGRAELTEAYDLTELQNLISKVELGIAIPQCSGISNISKSLMSNYLAELQVEVVEVQTVEHTLNMASYSSNGENYHVLFDVQNGFIFPSLSDSELEVPSSLEFLEQNENDLQFYWLPQEVLNQKKNFMNEILPCNVLPQLGRDYHYAQDGSAYKYVIYGPSFHKVLWFDLEQLDLIAFKSELTKILKDRHKLAYPPQVQE